VFRTKPIMASTTLTTTKQQAEINYEDIKSELGDGPARFFNQNERSFSKQLTSLTDEQRACYDTLKKRWEEKERGHSFPDNMYLRFARNSPGKTKFKTESAWKVMKKYDQRYLSMSATKLEEQLMTKTLFLPPNLHSKDGHDVFYMRPSLYHPKQTPTQTIIDNLAYCMQSMSETEKSETEGIAFLANMDSWTFDNFSVSYCMNFMMMLQGRIPVRVRLFLIVNPPSWFGKIWSIMKRMLTADFRKKVHMIPGDRLSEFLEEGFEEYLPDDLASGKASIDDMVTDFVAYRNFIESPSE